MPTIHTLAREVLEHREKTMNADRTSPALQSALNRIALEFGNPNGNELRMARHMMRLGAADPGPRARYAVLATIAADCRYDIDAALVMLDKVIAEERRKLAVRFSRHHPLSLRIAKEARMICRWMRRHRPELWLWVLSALTTPVGHRVTMEAAE